MAQSLLQVFKAPLCLIETDRSGKLCIRSETLDQIKSIEQTLNIVTIAGLYRTGKSYLLNRLAGFNKGFPLGSTIESKTKGIWVWCRPHPVHKDQVLLLMDTEGLGDIEKGDKNHDNWLFALAVLLSSTLVYNIVGVFSEDNLEKLSFVTEISNHIKTSEKGKQKDDSEFDLFFPMFIVTLRDFSLEMKKDGKEITADMYLEEECLKLREEKSDRERKYNEPRRCIRKYFKIRKCFTFDRPAGRKQLAKLEEVTDADLSEDFVDDCNKFVAFIHKSSSPKKLSNGHVINGRMFAALVKSYIDAIRNGAIPCIENALTTMAEMENRKAVETALEMYNQEIRKCVKFPAADDKTLSNAHQQCMKKSLSYFLEKSIYDKDEKYQKELNKKMLEAYEKVRMDDALASVKSCEKTIEDLYAKIHKKLVEKKYSRAGGYTEYIKDLNEMQTEYSKKTELGCKTKETLLKFLEGKRSEGQTIQQGDEMITAKEKEAEAARQKAITAAREKQEIENQVQNLKEEYENLQRQMNENVKQLEGKRKIELEQMKDHYENVIKKRIEEERRLQEEGFKAKAEELSRQTMMLKQKLEEQEQVKINDSKIMQKTVQEFFDESKKQMSQIQLKREMMFKTELAQTKREKDLLEAELQQMRQKEKDLNQHNEVIKKKAESSCILL